MVTLNLTDEQADALRRLLEAVNALDTEDSILPYAQMDRGDARKVVYDLVRDIAPVVKCRDANAVPINDVLDALIRPRKRVA